MNEYDYCEIIKTQYKVVELNSKTLSYRINGFIKACNMNLDNSVCSKEISTHRLEYTKLEHHSDENSDINYVVNFYRSTDDNGNNVTLAGNYDDLSFRFINYVDDDNNYDIITELPFSISLSKEYDNFKYDLEIRNASKLRTKFILRKGKKEMLVPFIITFQANVFDFSMILKLVKAFANNPEQVFTSYSDIMNKKNPTLTCNDLGKGIMEDESLDEPVKGIKKLIRRLFK